MVKQSKQKRRREKRKELQSEAVIDIGSTEYEVADGRLRNQATGEMVPDGCPVYVIVATDLTSVNTLIFHKNTCQVIKRKNSDQVDIERFLHWQDSNADLVK